jgi:DNA-binding winged helix-turn-helix (wHTH) protein/tetratricopeptide (TPR) repeat protein
VFDSRNLPFVTSRFRTGDILIDLDAREIRRSDMPVDVEAKVFDLIALLLAGRERTLSKREINAALWDDRPVTDAALSQQLRKARRALGDDGDAQRVIRTVHGRGLRWVAPVVEESAPVVAVAPLDARVPTSRRPIAHSRWRLAIGVLLGGVLVAALFWWAWPGRVGDVRKATPRIAVLLVEDETGKPALAWVRTGMMGLMTSLFAQAGGIDVVAARDVQAIDTAARPLDAASAPILRRALGASHLVATRLRRVGPVYELELRLVAAGMAERGETLHGSAPAPLAVAAVRRVRGWLGVDALPDAGDHGIANPFLAEAYARGLDAQLHGDHGDAMKYFAICLDQDPGLAWPRLGLAISAAASGDMDRGADDAANVAAIARETGDEELLVAALRQQGSVAFRRGDLDAAAEYLDTALEDVSESRPLALTDLLVARASVEDERGNFTHSRELFERALALARGTGNRRGEAAVLVNLAVLDNRAGDAAGAGLRLREGLDAAREAGDGSLEGSTLANLGATEANQGRLLDAVALLKQALAIARRRGDAQLETLASIQLIRVLAPFGRNADIEALARRVADMAEREHNPYWQAELHWEAGNAAVRTNDWSRALDELEHARALYRDAGMVSNVAAVLADIVAAASAAGQAGDAHAAARAFRTIADADAQTWAAWLPLLDAQLRAVDGDVAGALANLARHLDATTRVGGAAAQAGLFQLGRWQLATGRFDDLLKRAAWKPWLAQHPDAIALRIAALRGAGRAADAEAEQARLDRLKREPVLDLAISGSTP